MKRKDTRKTLLPLALAVALGVPGAAHASIPLFKYAYLNYVNVDVGYSQRFVNAEGESLGRLESSSDSGFELGGAVGGDEGWHIFGLYHIADQKLDFSGGDIAIEPPIEGGDKTGSFDVTRWRIGAGYARPLVPDWTVYGRVSYDNSDVSGLRLGDTKLGGTSDSGIGAEVGALYTFSHRIVLSGWVRYTSVGESSSKVNDDAELAFDLGNDVLLGIHGRYIFTRRFALQAGYEAGTVSTFNFGGRFIF
jgi:hypothetical protein